MTKTFGGRRMKRLENCNHCSVELINEEMSFFDGKWYCSNCLYSLTTNKLFEKLQERCDRYEKALTEIASSRQYFSTGEISKFLPTEDAQIAIDALAAIGGNDE